MKDKTFNQRTTINRDRNINKLSMERSLNRSNNNLNQSISDFNNTLKSKTSSEKKVRFDESFVSQQSNKD